MLVVAADESVMPQTREHFQICRLLEMPAGLIVLTKADLADADTIELARLEVRELTAGSFLADAPIVVVSSKNGRGLDDLAAALLAAASRARARPRGPTRLPIDRVFSIKGFGTVVTGTLVSGTIREDDGARGASARAHGESPWCTGARPGDREATAGSRVAVNLGGVDVPISPAAIPCAPWCVRAYPASRRGRRPCSRDAPAACVMARACGFTRARPSCSGALRLRARREDGAPRRNRAGRSAYVRIRLEAPCRSHSRRSVHPARRTRRRSRLAVGVVLDPHPPRVGHPQRRRARRVSASRRGRDAPSSSG